VELGPDELPQIEVRIATLETGDRAYLVSVEGELDLYSAPRLQAELDALASDASDVVLDLSQVTFIDATALGAILAAGRRLREADGRLALVAATDATRKLLALVGVDRVLPIYESSERALEHLVGSVVLRKLEQ
jgi:anti-sigma B factor antagonist